MNLFFLTLNNTDEYVKYNKTDAIEIIIYLKNIKAKEFSFYWALNKLTKRFVKYYLKTSSKLKLI